MDFEEFREKLKEDLAERLFDRTGDDFEITSSSVNKLQNAGYEGISVRKEGEAKGITYGMAVRELAELNGIDLGEKQI